MTSKGDVLFPAHSFLPDTFQSASEFGRIGRILADRNERSHGTRIDEQQDELDVARRRRSPRRRGIGFQFHFDFFPGTRLR